jgi:cell division inhibitor SepF
MSNFMKNARTWLGLGNDPYYEDEYGDPEFDDDDVELEPVDEDVVDVAPAAAPVARPRAVGSTNARPAPAPSAVPAASRASDFDDGDGGVRVISAPAPSTTSDFDNRGVVRPLPSASKPHVVTPTTFNDVQEVADAFKRAQPVIVNLQGVDRDLSRRLIDFGSGLCYGLEGNMERVTDQVFLLTPHGAEVSDDDRRRIREGGLVADDH